MPVRVNFSFTSALASAPFSALLSAAIVAAGVFAGSQRLYQGLPVASLKPTSNMVGMSGKVVVRFSAN